jgi:hypothetical protein
MGRSDRDRTRGLLQPRARRRLTPSLMPGISTGSQVSRAVTHRRCAQDVWYRCVHAIDHWQIGRKLLAEVGQPDSSQNAYEDHSHNFEHWRAFREPWPHAPAVKREPAVVLRRRHRPLF